MTVTSVVKDTRVALSEPAGGDAQMDITTTWPAPGTEAGMTAAAGQIDELLSLPARA